MIFLIIAGSMYGFYQTQLEQIIVNYNTIKYKEETIELNQSKADAVTEAHIIAKYGGLFVADPDIDKRELVLRINSEQVFYQADKPGVNRTYTVFTEWDQTSMLSLNQQNCLRCQTI